MRLQLRENFKRLFKHLRTILYISVSNSTSFLYSPIEFVWCLTSFTESDVFMQMEEKRVNSS